MSECSLGVLNLTSRNSKSYMVPTASITLSTGTYVVFCISVYAKKFMPWSVCKTLPTYVSHSCCNSKVLGFCAFKLTVITIHQSLFLHWNSILDIFFFTVYNQNTHIDLLLKYLSFSVHSERTAAGHLLLLRHFMPNIFSNVCLFFQCHGHLPLWKVIFVAHVKFSS